jgi:hypothetical protein
MTLRETPRTYVSEGKGESFVVDQLSGSGVRKGIGPTPLFTSVAARARMPRVVCAMRRPTDERALMSVRFDMEAAEPNPGQPRDGVELMPVSLGESLEVQRLRDAGPGSSGPVA